MCHLSVSVLLFSRCFMLMLYDPSFMTFFEGILLVNMGHGGCCHVLQPRPPLKNQKPELSCPRCISLYLVTTVEEESRTTLRAWSMRFPRAVCVWLLLLSAAKQGTAIRRALSSPLLESCKGFWSRHVTGHDCTTTKYVTKGVLLCYR